MWSTSQTGPLRHLLIVKSRRGSSSSCVIRKRNGAFSATVLILANGKGNTFLVAIYLCNSFEVMQLYYDINLVDIHIEGHEASSVKPTVFISKRLLPNIPMKAPSEFPGICSRNLGVCNLCF